MVTGSFAMMLAVVLFAVLESAGNSNSKRAVKRQSIFFILMPCKINGLYKYGIFKGKMKILLQSLKII